MIFKKKKKIMRAITTIFFLFLTISGFSQIQTPQPSPSSKLEQMVGLTDIEINYNRPSKRDRVIFGKFSSIW